MNKCTERLYNGLVKENPTFVLMLGMCPTLAVTTSAINGIGMGLSTTLYSSDCCKLYHPRKSRELCFKESGSSFYL